MSLPRRWSAAPALAAVALLALAAAPASHASLTEPYGVSYQFDGATHHDAPDTCGAATPEWNLPVGGLTDGMLVPPEDAVDVFVMDVAPSQVGQRLDVRAFKDLTAPEVAFRIDMPACGTSIALTENWPAPFPSPPLPLAGQTTVPLPRIESDTCASDWTFKVTGVTTAPPSIYVAWTDGTTQVVPHDHGEGMSAFYTTSYDPTTTLKGAWINLPADWSGSFGLLNGPCGAMDGGAVYGNPPEVTKDRIRFTPIAPGPFTLVVVPASPQVPGVPTSIPANCHYCAPQVEVLAKALSYNFQASIAA